jgi:hypothetical protein
MQNIKHMMGNNKEFDRLLYELDGRDDPQYGGIVGKVDIIECVSYSDSKWFEGPWGFVLNNAQSLSFLPVKGKLKFFETDYPDLAKSLNCK